MANLVSQKAKMTFSLAGKNRPNKPDSAVLDAIQGAVTKALGPGYSVNVYSGKEHPGQQTGSNRHKTGLAADVHIIGPDGKTLNATDNKQQMLDVAAAFKELGGMGVGLGTDYMGGVGIHLDMFTPGPRQDSAWGNIGNAYQGWLDSFSRSQIAAQTPDEMQAPQSREQAMAPRPDPMPGGLAAYTPPAKAAGTPALALNSMVAGRPEYPGSMPAAPLNSMVAARPEYPGSMPAARALSMPAGTPALSLNSMVAGRPEFAGSLPASRPSAPSTQAVRPALSAGSLPAARQQTTVATRPSTPSPTGLPAARTQTTVAARPSTPATTGLPAARAQTTVASRPGTPAPTGLSAASPSTSKLADAYAQMGQTKAIAAAQPALAAYEAVRTAPPVPVAPPAVTMPPAQVLAPLLTPPKVVKDYPVAEAIQAPTPPRATAYDVYSGLADTALDNTGQNTVSAMPGGGTSVTNKYGATTGMTPGGYQTAVGSLPGISGPATSQFGSKLGGAVKGAIPGVAGSALGGILGRPLGALLGAAIAKAATQPGGLINNALGGGYAAKGDAIGGLSASQQANARSLDKQAAASGYNRSNSTSPRAQAAIDAGVSGLY